VPVEAGTRLSDLQALVRRIHPKQRDAAGERVILLVADPRGNRLTVAAAPDAWRGPFPVGTRTTLGLLRRGERPSASGVIVL
jgi:hypothetical protein